MQILYQLNHGSSIYFILKGIPRLGDKLHSCSKAQLYIQQHLTFLKSKAVSLWVP